ncbi:hypothetical protein FHG87_015088 [Trinorchestia longiramus]|nr:hypothetical protein FHG87_015088 [Trinorchestia longiramus]
MVEFPCGVPFIVGDAANREPKPAPASPSPHPQAQARTREPKPASPHPRAQAQARKPVSVDLDFRPCTRLLDHVLDYLLDHVLDQALDHVLDYVLDHVLDYVLDQVPDYVLDQVLDHVLDYVLEHVPDHMLDQSPVGQGESLQRTDDTQKAPVAAAQASASVTAEADSGSGLSFNFAATKAVLAAIFRGNQENKAVELDETVSVTVIPEEEPKLTKEPTSAKSKEQPPAKRNETTNVKVEEPQDDEEAPEEGCKSLSGSRLVRTRIRRSIVRRLKIVSVSMTSFAAAAACLHDCHCWPCFSSDVFERQVPYITFLFSPLPPRLQV